MTTIQKEIWGNQIRLTLPLGHTEQDAIQFSNLVWLCEVDNFEDDVAIVNGAKLAKVCKTIGHFRGFDAIRFDTIEQHDTQETIDIEHKLGEQQDAENLWTNYRPSIAKHFDTKTAKQFNLVTA